MRRRSFIKNTGVLVGGLAYLEQAALAAGPRSTNPLPKWKGFNVLDFFSPNPVPSAHPTTEDHIRWMREWKDDAALDAFCFHWNFWAHRYRTIAKDKISFDLLNEPAMREDMNDQHSPGTAIPGEVYRKVVGAAGVILLMPFRTTKHPGRTKIRICARNPIGLDRWGINT
jgi:hypothetical protein